jgi:hypothetical protein
MISISEFTALVDIITSRYGEGVYITGEDEHGRMFLTREGQTLGYLDVKNKMLMELK